jgi:hypothetical protein
MRLSACSVLAALASAALAQGIKGQYQKHEYMVPARDGRRLYVAVYVPKDKPGPHPILLERTPYGAGPYGPDAYRRGFRGSAKFEEAGYAFAFSDVRGRGRSEGEFVNIRPQLTVRTGPHDVDESTDTWDTIEFLVKNVPGNNGRVGLWGISYPGGYAALGAIDSHPALRAASPQAPTADWFLGDDDHHNGAFFLQDSFSFFSGMGSKNVPWTPTPERGVFSFNLGGDAYKFFLDLGPVKNTNGPQYFGGRYDFWNDLMRHGAYDDFWQSRSVPAAMKGVTCAVLNVGGWFDAEDLYGPLQVYRRTEAQNPAAWNALVMGPWQHGGWAGTGRSLGRVDFGADTGRWYQDEVEFPFFDAFLRGEGSPAVSEATVFETGSNRWHKMDEWPPSDAVPTSYYLHPDGGLSTVLPPATASPQSDRYVSDPAAPTPYEGGTLGRRSTTYMIADQRFASSRSDVLTYQTPPLESDTTWAGPVHADLWVSMTGTDADFVVKVVDVHPDGAKGVADFDLSGAQILVRAEVMRGKFRDSMSNPSPFVPGQPTRVRYALPDVFHTFRKGHRIMVQVQSSWFPLVDRNPNTFCDIYSCEESAFQKNTIDVHRSGEHSSRVVAGVWTPS